jgi:hypothetical protein
LDKELITSLSDLLDEKLTPIKNDLKNIKFQQEEGIAILRALEHKADILLCI